MLQFEHVIDIIDAHTAGEPVRFIVSGLPQIKGGTMLERLEYFRDNCDGLRKLILREPRGHRDMYGVVLTPPATEDGDLGLFFIYNGGLSTMCGHATIGSVKIAVDTGMVNTVEGANLVRVDTPAGRVDVTAEVRNGRAGDISFTNVPSFVYMKDVEVPVDGCGKVKLDIAYSGAFMCYVDAEALGLKVSPEFSGENVSRALAIKSWVNGNMKIVNPENPGIKGIYGVEVLSPFRKTADGLQRSNVCVVGEGAMDRSPCGVGTSGQMALLCAKGLLGLGDKYHSFSIIGSEFTGVVTDTTKICGIDAIVPQITGRAYISGFNKLVLDPDDPFQQGFWL